MGEPHRKGNRKPDRQHGARSQPISRHPLFPAIVALWGAALLGLAGLMLAPALLEQLVSALHVDTLVPAVAPPLGKTARLVLGLALGVPGAIAGWVAGRRMAGPRPVIKHAVLNPAQDLGSELPWPAVKAYPADYADESPAADVPELDLAGLAAPHRDLPDAAVEPLLSAADRTPEADASPPTVTPQPEAPHPEAPQPPTAAERIAAADLAGLSHVELVERLALAISRRHDRRAGEGELPQPVLRFPGLADRQGARLPLPADPANALSTEYALRQALAQLRRMSGNA